MFRSQKIIDQDIMEVDMAKKTVRWNLPIQVGYFVYQYAKLRMLEFYYDCLLQFFKWSDFELCQMDTDSLYFAISGSSLDDIVRDEKRADFYCSYHKWFPSLSCDNHRHEFVTAKCRGEPWDPTLRTCCSNRLKYDKRTPGLFKVYSIVVNNIKQVYL